MLYTLFGNLTRLGNGKDVLLEVVNWSVKGVNMEKVNPFMAEVVII